MQQFFSCSSSGHPVEKIPSLLNNPGITVSYSVTWECSTGVPCCLVHTEVPGNHTYPEVIPKVVHTRDTPREVYLVERYPPWKYPGKYNLSGKVPGRYNLGV